MKPDELARIIAASIARRQSRGLVDDATGMADVVIHGRVNLLLVAQDVLDASSADAKPQRRSWARWFVRGVEDRQFSRRQAWQRQDLAEKLENGLTSADLAIVRMRMRSLDD